MALGKGVEVWCMLCKGEWLNFFKKNVFSIVIFIPDENVFSFKNTDNAYSGSLPDVRNTS